MKLIAFLFFLWVLLLQLEIRDIKKVISEQMKEINELKNGS